MPAREKDDIAKSTYFDENFANISFICWCYLGVFLHVFMFCLVINQEPLGELFFYVVHICILGLDAADSLTKATG